MYDMDIIKKRSRTGMPLNKITVKGLATVWIPAAKP
jgi:hypothetical protein